MAGDKAAMFLRTHLEDRHDEEALKHLDELECDRNVAWREALVLSEIVAEIKNFDSYDTPGDDSDHLDAIRDLLGHRL